MNTQEMIDLCKQHTMYTWAATDQVTPLPVARAQGVYIYTPEGRRILDFNSAADERAHRPPPPPRHRGDEGPARRADLRVPADRHGGTRAAGQADGRGHPRLSHLLLHARRRRGQRERHPRRAPLHRAPEDPEPLPQLPRRHQPHDAAHRRPAPLAERARLPGHRPRDGPAALPVLVRQDRRGEDRREPRLPRGDHRVRGPAHHRGDDHRDGHRHQRRAPAARRLPAGPQAAAREARHPADLRRGDVRHGPHRQDDGLRARRHRSRHRARWPRGSPAPTSRSAPWASPTPSPRTSARTSSGAASPTTRTRSASPRRRRSSR